MSHASPARLKPGRLPLIAAVVALIAGFCIAPASQAAASEARCDTISGLEKAPTLSDDFAPDGTPVQETTLPDGSQIPVVVVHGWTGRSDHTSTRDGVFSPKVDMISIKGAEVSLDRSVIGQIQNLGGTAVYTFDYHDTSARWVTDDSIGPKLAEAMSCLSAAYGHKVIVVAHSMGGLAVRQGLALLGARATTVASDVITFGTPNTGSNLAAALDGTLTWGQFAPGVPGSAIAAFRSVVVACGTPTSKSLDKAGLCGILPDFISSFDSQAGRALRTGSDELRNLAPWPEGINVQALAGDVGIEVMNVSWFGLSRKAGRIDVGDVIVSTDSAVAGADETHKVSCEFTLNPGTATADNVLEGLKLKPTNDTRDFGVGLGSVCDHNSLPRSIELTNTMTSTIVERLDAVASRMATDTVVLNSAMPVAACIGWEYDQPAAVVPLTDGSGEWRDESGEFLGINFLETTVIGRADVDTNGIDDVVVQIMCSGTETAQCCAGRASIMTYVAAVNLTSDGSLKLVGDVLEGGASYPGDQYGPAQRKIRDARLEGNVVVTSEFIIYDHLYTREQVGHDPTAEVVVRYRFRDGQWVAEG